MLLFALTVHQAVHHSINCIFSFVVIFSTGEPPAKKSSNMGMDSEMGIDDGEKKQKSGMYCSNGQIFFAVLVSAGIVVAVGLLCFYLPDRTCPEEVGPTEPIKQPDEPTEPQPPEPETTKATEPPPPTPTPEPWNGRLPYTVIPLRYDLTLTPYLYQEDVDSGPGQRRFTFDGEVNIRATCKEATDMITMHINNITIYDLKVVLMTDGGQTDLVESWSIDEFYQFLNIKLNVEMTAEEDYEIMITYLGELWSGLAGFYRSSYTNDKGEER